MECTYTIHGTKVVVISLLGYGRVALEADGNFFLILWLPLDDVSTTPIGSVLFPSVLFQQLIMACHDLLHSFVVIQGGQVSQLVSFVFHNLPQNAAHDLP